MDMTLELVIASAALFFTGLILCLGIVGFGRVTIISGTIAATSVVASIGCLQLIGAVWDSPSPHEVNFLSKLARTDRLLWISQTLLAVGVLSAMAFSFVGSLRVWRRRSVIATRFNSHHAGTTEVPATPNAAELTTRDRIGAVVATLVLAGVVGWELFEFVVTNRGVQYYRDHPLMLILPVGLAALVGVVLVLFSQYARRHAIQRSRRSR